MRIPFTTASRRRPALVRPVNVTVTTRRVDTATHPARPREGARQDRAGVLRRCRCQVPRLLPGRRVDPVAAGERGPAVRCNDHRERACPTFLRRHAPHGLPALRVHAAPTRQHPIPAGGDGEMSSNDCGGGADRDRQLLLSTLHGDEAQATVRAESRDDLFARHESDLPGEVLWGRLITEAPHEFVPMCDVVAHRGRTLPNGTAFQCDWMVQNPSLLGLTA